MTGCDPHGLTYPLEALFTSSGLPSTILLSGTPAYEFISITDVDGQPFPESKMRDWSQIGSMPRIFRSMGNRLGQQTHIAVLVDTLPLVVELNIILMISRMFGGANVP